MKPQAVGEQKQQKQQQQQQPFKSEALDRLIAVSRTGNQSYGIFTPKIIAYLRPSSNHSLDQI